VETVDRAAGADVLRYSATIQPYEQIPLAFKVSGYVREVHQRAGADGRVEWMGLLSPGQLAAVRKGALAALVPSRKEGFGLPVLEAMAAGVPVLASDTPALREVGGDAAAYLPADDPGAWAEAIGALASDGVLREARAEAGLRRAATFSWRRAAEAVADAHRDAAA